MKLRWLRPFVVLAAALIVCISNMTSKRPMLESLVWLLLTIIIFYVIGSIVTRIIDVTMHSSGKGNAEAVTEDKPEEPLENVKTNEEELEYNN
ncbi:MAG: hypothetical protein K2N24_12240 [Lachnospiraceae bacterium]|nr:hypothetical protein [Lachnospiraceae bacterium]